MNQATKPEDCLGWTVTERSLTGAEVAMHVLAQTTRFVIRKQMTAEEAAALSLEMANAFVEACNESGEADPECREGETKAESEKGP